MQRDGNMNSIRIWIVVAAIAVAANLRVVTGMNYTLDDICSKVDEDMRKANVRMHDGEEVFKFAKTELEKAPWIIQGGRISEAWDNIYHGMNCSDKSLEYLFDIGLCKVFADRFLVLNEPYKAYVRKCFKSSELDEKIKSAAEKVDFIDNEFIKEYRRQNPQHLDEGETRLYLRDNCCDPSESVEAVNDAIQRDLNGKGEDPKKFFTEPADVSKYLKEKLFQPCANLKQSFGDLYPGILFVGHHYESSVKGLYASLGEEASEVLFSFKYCRYASRYTWKKLVDEALKKFAPQLELTDGEKSTIRVDCLVPGSVDYEIHYRI